MIDLYPIEIKVFSLIDGNQPKGVKPKVRECTLRSVNWQGASKLKKRKTNGRKTMAWRM
jgi:hypothetical protein